MLKFLHDAHNSSEVKTPAGSFLIFMLPQIETVRQQENCRCGGTTPNQIAGNRLKFIFSDSNVFSFTKSVSKSLVYE